MKKRSIEGFLNRIQENKNGALSGGFASIKGGLLSMQQTNDRCGNDTVCWGNNTACSNSMDCSDSTNVRGLQGCSNTGSCFM